jgi:hypothetical protein
MTIFAKKGSTGAQKYVIKNFLKTADLLAFRNDGIVIAWIPSCYSTRQGILHLKKHG